MAEKQIQNEQINAPSKPTVPWVFYLIAIICGGVVGIVGGYFQVFLHLADYYRLMLVHWAWGAGPVKGFLTILAICVICAVIARALVRLAKRAGGSGIQYVEAFWRDEVTAAKLRVVPVKFIGGLLSLGSGMALGREGPTVQMGAAIGAWFGRVCRLTKEEFKFLTMAAAGAGLAVAFSAPLGGSMFTFEEVTRSLKIRLVSATLLCACVGCTVSMTILGSQPDYTVLVKTFLFPDFKSMSCALLFGIFVGLCGMLYNELVLILLDFQNYLHKIPAEIRAGLIGVVVAILLWFAPHWAGGGDNLANQMLNQTFPITVLLMIAVVRWFFAPICYSSGVPGGLFSPLLLMGGILGHLFCWGFSLVGVQLNPMEFCAIGMAAFFAGTICAPLTGVLLILEMTACWDLTILMLFASIAAFATSRFVGSLPIYTALRLRIKEVKELEAKGVNVLAE